MSQPLTGPLGPLGAQRFELLVEAVVDYAIFMLDPVGRILSWNSGAQALKQYTRAEVIGRHFSLFYPPEAISRGWPEEELKRAKTLGRFEDEGWRLRKDGSRFWANVVITPLWEPDGSLAGYAKVTRDLSERRRHEEALRESEERFRLLIEGVRDYAIFMLDPTGVIQSWNAGAELIKGYRAEEVMGRHFSLFYTPDDLKAGKPTAELLLAVRVGRAEEEGWRVRKDGSLFWANVVITPLLDAKGRLRGFAKVTRDMSDRRRLVDLERSSQRMTEFLAMMAHELRNPLAPIRNAVTIMQLEPVESPSLRASRDVIDRQLTHLTRLVDDLLDVGRMTTGKVNLRRERVFFNQLVTRALEAVRPLMDSRRHTLTIDLIPGDVSIDADGMRIVQVLQNLLINAGKYTPEHGTISVTAKLEGAWLVCTVRDSGPGLTQESIETIFTLFAQGEAAARESGLGIGLTLARSLIEMHGGTLSARSEGLGHGSSFTFSLPNAQLQTPEDEAAEANALRCLVVDDNRDAADSMAQIARLLGCSVRVAYDGPSAIELAKTFSPEVALLDLGMPGMSGYELIAHLRELPSGDTTVIAALTGYGNEEDRKRTTAAGFDEHLTKPVEITLVKRLLAKARSKLRPAVSQ